MACIIKGCKIESDVERMICCWLCYGHCHIKCSGLRTTVAEAVSNCNQNGLCWRCPDCRQIGADFHRFFQSTKKLFLEVKDEASKLSERISAYGRLFEEFKSLDSLKFPQSSPKRRKPSNKDHTNKEKSDENYQSPSNNNSNNINCQLPNAAQTLINFQHPPVSYAQALTSSGPSLPAVNFNSNSVPTPQPMLFSYHNPSTNSLIPSNTNNNNINIIPSIPSNVINNLNPPFPALDTSASCSSRTANHLTVNSNNNAHIPSNLITNNINNNNVHSASKPLVVAPSRKAIFISRFASDTTETDVADYVKSKIGIDTEITVYKFVFMEKRNKSSFKIIIPEDVFETVVNSNFWPAKAIVHEYIYRENVARLPNLAKN